jgi:hypothetical protein
MKPSIPTVAMISLAAVATYALFAQTQLSEPGAMQGGMAPDGNGNMVQMCPMCSMLAGAMTPRAMVATEDLGVVVLVGNRLMRFDAGLNKIAETEIPIDMQWMQGQMMHMMQNCPMHRQMRPGQFSAGPAPQAGARRDYQTGNP